MAMSVLPKPVCPLYLGVDWSYDQHGIAVVNKMLIEDVNDLSSEIPVYCAILKEEKSITEAERKDAKKCNVTLIGAEPPKGRKSPLDIDAMNINSRAFYSQVESKCPNVTHIIGHVPKLSYAAINFKEILSKKSGQDPKVVLVIHDLPKDSDGSILEDEVEEILGDADLIISLGKQTYHAVEKYVGALSTNPTHTWYIPSPPVDLLQIEMPKSTSDHIEGAQNLLLHGSDFVNIDFDLAVTSTIKASDWIFQNATQKDHVSVVLQVVKDPMCKEDLKAGFEKLKKETDSKYKKLKFSQEIVENKQKVPKILKKSNLCIHPTSTESTVLGMEPLMAAYAGLPVLMSDGTGAAGVFETLNLIDSIVKTLGDFKADSETWCSQIFNKLKDPKASLEEAGRVRKTLLLDKTIPNSHLDVLEEMSGLSNLKWRVDLQAVSEDMKHGILKDFDIPSLNGIDNPTEFIQTLLFYLLQQRGKVSKGLLNPYFPKSLLTVWKEFLRILEAEGRKVTGIHHGSLVFSIFCPTEISRINLCKDIEGKKFTLVNSLERLLREIVAVACVVKVDEVAMDEISKSWALAAVKEYSGCFMKSGDTNLYEHVGQQNHLPGLTNIADVKKSSQFWTQIVSYFQNAKAFDLSWVDRRIDLERLQKLTQTRVLQHLAQDESHYTYKKHVTDDMCDEKDDISVVLEELYSMPLSKETTEKLIAACAKDANWNAEKYPVVLRKGRKMIPFRSDKVTEYGSRDLFIKLSEIVIPDANTIREKLQRAILAEEDGQVYWEGFTKKGVEFICTSIRIAFGHFLRELMKAKYSQVVEAQRTLSTDSYILTDLEDMIVDSVHEVVEEGGASKEDTIKQLLEDNDEMEKKIVSSYWAKIFPFINSHRGLLNERIVERGVFDLQNANDLGKMVENIKTKLTTKLQKVLDEIDVEKREEIEKYLEQYIPGKVTRLMYLFETQIQGYASLLDIEAMARTA